MYKVSAWNRRGRGLALPVMATGLAGLGFAVLTGVAGLRPALVIASTLVSAASSVPYLLATIRGTAKPRLVTWGTWCLLTAMAAAASATAHDFPAAVFALVGTIATGTIVIVGWRHGDLTIGWLDVACLLLVMVGLVVWRLLQQPAVAVLVACLVDAIGLVPTLVHVIQAPHEEEPHAYALIGTGALLAGLASWGDWTITAIAYPAYVFVSVGLVAVLAIRAAPHLPTRTIKTSQGPANMAEPAPCLRPPTSRPRWTGSGQTGRSASPRRFK